jgi:hypothetical protein
MKGTLVAVLLVVLLAGAGGAYLLLHSSSPPNTSTGTGINESASSSSTPQVQGAPAHVTVSHVSCNSNQALCVISLVNSGGTAVGATGCTLNGSPGVFAPKPSNIPPQALVNVSCSPSNGNALSIPGFHVTGTILLSDGSSVQYTGSWQ